MTDLSVIIADNKAAFEAAFEAAVASGLAMHNFTEEEDFVFAQDAYSKASDIVHDALNTLIASTVVSKLAIRMGVITEK
jgi:hypothetical protein